MNTSSGGSSGGGMLNGNSGIPPFESETNRILSPYEDYSQSWSGVSSPSFPPSLSLPFLHFISSHFISFFLSHYLDIALVPLPLRSRIHSDLIRRRYARFLRHASPLRNAHRPNPTFRDRLRNRRSVPSAPPRHPATRIPKF